MQSFDLPVVSTYAKQDISIPPLRSRVFPVPPFRSFTISVPLSKRVSEPPLLGAYRITRKLGNTLRRTYAIEGAKYGLNIWDKHLLQMLANFIVFIL